MQMVSFPIVYSWLGFALDVAGDFCLDFLCVQAGANMIVSGTAVVRSDNPKSVMDEMREVVTKAQENWPKP